MLGKTNIDASNIKIGGTEISYYTICKTKLWLYTHGMQMEHTSDRVKLGKLLHEDTYTRYTKEIMIDDLLCIDFDESNDIIHEVKLTKAFEEAHKLQLLYYLYYLKLKGLTGLKGIINYPKAKRTVKVELTSELEEELLHIIENIKHIKQNNTCPEHVQTRVCKKCSYEDLCWG